MPKLAAARFVLVEFGPLMVFWALALTLGVKPAIHRIARRDRRRRRLAAA
ncbi:MAG TPA: hypothetical protein VFE63_02595 [Roseiarcus sp.]|jgi:hypothetical protein|nr:hypothetical protein [Roseiarcus sp.]